MVHQLSQPSEEESWLAQARIDLNNSERFADDRQVSNPIDAVQHDIDRLDAGPIGADGAHFDITRVIPGENVRPYDRATPPAFPDWFTITGSPVILTTAEGREIVGLQNSDGIFNPSLGNVSGTASPELQDNLLGNIVGAVFETPMAIASSVAGGLVGSVVGLVNGFTTGKYGTPEGVREASELAGSVAQAMVYRPSTATGREFAQTIGQWANDSGIGGLGFSELNALQAVTSSAMRVGANSTAASPFVTTPTRAAVRELKDFGLDSAQRRSFFEGKQVIFEDPATAFDTATIFKLSPDTLHAGVYDIISDGSGAVLSFANRSRSLGNSLGVKNLELFGADIQNAQLQSLLVRRGFEPGAPVRIDAFGFDKYVETLRKTEVLRK